MNKGTLGAWIKAWRNWKLSHGESLGWPKETMLGKLIRLGPDGFHAQRTSVPEELLEREHEELVDSAVKTMAEARPVLHAAFIAYHLGEIRRESARHLPIRARAIIMGITPKTLYRRLNEAENWLRVELEERFDSQG